LAGSRVAAYFKNERRAAKRAFRVRTQLPRRCSRWSRKARTVGASRSTKVSAVGGRPRDSAKKFSRRRKVSLYEVTVRVLTFCWAMSRPQKNSRTSVAKPGTAVVVVIGGLQGWGHRSTRTERRPS